MTTDDIDLPDLPALGYTYDDHPNDQKNTDFESLTPIDISPQIETSRISKSDLAPLTLQSIDEKILVSELADCSLYLRNIHKGFKHVTSTKSLISLVAAGIGVHKLRRQVIESVKNKQNATFEIDEHGNPIRR